MKQLRTRLDGTGARTALVRGASAPPRPAETLTVAPGVSATVGPCGRRAPLYVTAEAPSGRTVREYDGADAEAAADCAATLADERDPQAVWLCDRDQIRSWWGDGVADLLERRLATVARRTDARLVVWSNADGPGASDAGVGDDAGADDDDAIASGNEGGSSEAGAGSAGDTAADEDGRRVREDDEAVGDRYDVVVVP